MPRILAVLSLLVTVGCSVGPTPQEEYDMALKIVNRQQERLDALRPAYDAAQQTAALTVCKEIAGVTPEESQTAALEQLQNVMGQAIDAPPPASPATDKKTDKKTDKTNVNDIDATIDNLVSAEASFQKQQAAITAPMAKANEVMTHIKTPGTPENKRFVEVLEAMPEVKAYRRQEKRLERAQKVADAAEKKANSAATN
jgi:hypothetical protein